MRLEILTNHVAGGWLPSDLATGLGGGEECIVLFAEALARCGISPTVFLNPPTFDFQSFSVNGVTYRARADFDAHKPRDVLITWKASTPWAVNASAALRIHWSSDVEPAWQASTLRSIDYFVCFSKFHRSRLSWLPDDKACVFPLGIDKAYLDAHKCEREQNTALYCSSYDRGLEALLIDWPEICRLHPEIELRVAYGWRVFDAVTGIVRGEGSPAALAFKERINGLLQQKGITVLGQISLHEMAFEYHRAEYWIHPLNSPDAELFCLNAIKARHCGAMPIVNRIGALQNTVGQWVPYHRFSRRPGWEVISGKDAADIVPVLDWDEVVDRYWLPMIKEKLAA